MTPTVETPTARRGAGGAARRITDRIKRLRSHESTLRALAATLLGGLAAQLTLVVTGVILARALGPQDRGYLGLLTVIAALGFLVGPLGLPYALTFSVARVPGRAVEIVRGTMTAIGVRLVAATLVSAALLVFLTRDKPGYVQAGSVVAVVIIGPSILQLCGLGVLQGLQRFTTFNVLRVAPNAAFAVVAGALALAGRAGFVEMTVAWGATAVLVAPVTTWRAWTAASRGRDPIAPEPPTRSWILRFGRRSMLGAQPVIETYRLDQAVVAVFLAPVSLGLYIVALAFTNLPRFVAQAVGMVANPFVASSETHGRARRRMWRFSWAAIPLYVPVIVVLWILAPQLVSFFFGTQFAHAAPLTRLLLIATALYCARTVLTDAARGAGYPVAGSVAEVVATISAVPFFAIFVPSWGTHGVAYALIASSAVALAVLIGILLRPSARRSIPSGWFDVLRREGVDALPHRVDQPEPVVE
jgi:O-antigen/teichoic acid export membrane protein